MFKIIKKSFFFWLGGVSPAPPVDFCDSGDTDIVQIAKLVMQIHANCVLIIDEIKNKKIFNGRCLCNVRVL